MPSLPFPRPVLLICLISFSNTFSIGAFPVLLPEVGRAGGFDDFALGAVAAAFGLARLLADIPAGLFITHHLRRALVLGCLAWVLGIACLATGGTWGVLLVGRALCGLAHTLSMIAGLTLILRFARPGAQSLSLNANEMTAMLGVMGGIIAVGAMPAHWPWNLSLLVASAPLAITAIALPLLWREVPPDEPSASGRPLFSRGAEFDAGGQAPSSFSRLGLIVLATGLVLSMAWSSVGQFILPLRLSRDFEFSRQGLALMMALPQLVDACLLLPVGAVADRQPRTRVLGALLLVVCVSLLLAAYGSLPLVVVGCLLFGLGLTAWMIPVSLLNAGGSPRTMAWRTSIYRVCVDAGVFIGPLLTGYLAQRGLMGGVGITCAMALLVLAVLLLRHPRESSAAREI